MNEDAARQRIEYELDQNLGPELVNKRRTPDNQTSLHYLTIHQACSLANEIFGADNWSVEVKWDQAEVSEDPETGGFIAWSLSCVRVSLKSGTHHEDVGSARARGIRKLEAINKAKSMAKADATKRALRQFGQVLGNCLYDNEYTSHLDTLPPV